MENTFRGTITVDDLEIEMNEYGDFFGGREPDYSIGIKNEEGIMTAILVDYIPSEDEAKNMLNDVVDYYNNRLWDNQTILHLMANYNSHIKKYNNEGWKNRGDFNTPEKYESFITGLKRSITNSIYILMTQKFGKLHKIEKSQIFNS